MMEQLLVKRWQAKQQMLLNLKQQHSLLRSIFIIHSCILPVLGLLAFVSNGYFLPASYAESNMRVPALLFKETKG